MRVPVLSKTTVSSFDARSSAPASLNRIPRRAPIPVPTMIAVGVASPSASGHAMTITVIANRSAVSNEDPMNQNHVAKVASPPPSATSTSQNAARSARRCAGAFELCAACTRATICASAVSDPTFVARARREPSRLIVAPIRGSPGRLVTGRLSPVIIDSSTLEVPSSTTASTGTLLPGRTSSRSPTRTSAVGISTGTPSRSTTATGGASSSSARTASEAPARARSSIQCPNSTKAASRLTASKKCSPSKPRTTATE
ncbi:MAG: hypothetical protein KatS3mg014_1220 [Actinomycetota bacterium]|nr:MAG: hypothetical protein KatS3mg014_1220 [Actinomycetota bacterium]